MESRKNKMLNSAFGFGKERLTLTGIQMRSNKMSADASDARKTLVVVFIPRYLRKKAMQMSFEKTN